MKQLAKQSWYLVRLRTDIHHLRTRAMNMPLHGAGVHKHCKHSSTQYCEGADYTLLPARYSTGQVPGRLEPHTTLLCTVYRPQACCEWSCTKDP